MARPMARPRVRPTVLLAMAGWSAACLDAPRRPAATDAGATDAGVPCEGGSKSTSVDGHCYVAFDAPSSWQVARDACEALGAHLITETTTGDTELLADLVGVDARIWLGGYQLGLEWRWVTLEPWSDFNWLAGEPNVGSGACLTGMYVGQWVDQVCGTELGYVCESE